MPYKKKMTTEFFSISIAIIVLAQQILHLAKKENFVEELVHNCELIKPKWSTTELNTCNQVTV